MRIERISSLLDPRFFFRPDIFLRACVRKVRTRPDRVLLRTSWGDALEVDPRKFIGAHLYLRGVHELPVCEALVRLTDPGETVADIGANIGVMTCLLSRQVGERGWVFAIEAHPQVAKDLRDNMNLWARHNIHIIHAAVSKVSGVLTIQEAPDSETNEGTAHVSTNACRVRSGKRFEVRAVRLDEEFPTAKLALIKIDVEGHELAVLEGAAGLLEKRTIRDIVFEGTRDCQSEARRLLVWYGYAVFRLEGGFFRPRLVEPAEPSKRVEPAADFVATTNPERALKRFATGGWKALRRNF